ncbi:DUF4297 family anti-phage-associated protein [Xanthomonas citri pv. glycines]|uniref:Restriction endonuclease n=1 Tax=Xanthomonas campestris pv. glycines TaxID=473421 RepID=A0AAX0I079_XANCG|nr:MULTISPECIES: DUF4297 family anti-phage-associated protein [Xanthomonas]AOY62481.1 hypothetical protein BHE84_10140 [Xanthomonas citri pv. glycines str. 8ra]ARV23808.1 hypothetical protein A9D66_14705 [Xanthomonas citri pv. glycines str. 12-2]EWC52058.1 hypothetical protein XAR_1356 [Xanthomonas citri pv. glycines str. 8ra]OEY90254.1 hypothetical protein BIY41_14695 [Xanthomonas citri pv. glycines]OOX06027.1 hypothetical protein Xgly_06270 [Xanthomonas citri pv. glycines]
MTDRSATATIKGYFYQFDQTIVRLLEATKHGSITVEGVEDIDLDDGNESAFVQCKYYEGTEYNHSVIKEAVIHMLRHFHAADCSSDQVFRYRLHGHYRGGQHKLKLPLTDEFLKEHFLTYTRDKLVHKVHEELAITDGQLAAFRALLDIDVNALSYDDQQAKMFRLLEAEIQECTASDAQSFFYPMAINVVQELAINADEAKRKITKDQFLKAINRKDVVFSAWLREHLGREYFARMIRRKYFYFGRTKMPKASRFFVIEMGDEYEVDKASRMLVRLGQFFSHKEHQRTTASDRFCPYVLLRGVTREQLAELKESLWTQRVAFTDGYPFRDSEFSPAMLAADPTKDNLWTIKFVPNEQLALTIAACKGSLVEVYDFYRDSPLDSTLVSGGRGLHSIKSNSAYLLQEVMQA